MTLLDKAIVLMLPVVPKPVVQLFSSRYIAGSTLDEAIEVVGTLNGEGKLATVDVLVDSNVSIKPTALGLDLSYELCRENLETVLVEAARYGNFVRIDMEDSATTSDTLRLYRELREAGFDNVGVVLQAYLHRTLDDVRELADLEPNVRLCKGIYVEPHTIAFTGYEDVRANYVRALDALLETGAYVGIATHDEWLIGQALERVDEMDTADYEFQMLLGVRERRASELVAAGHRLRVYVPFGEHWYQYSLRRLQENPTMAGTIAKATVNRVLGR